jgi:hypothetical protein
LKALNQIKSVPALSVYALIVFHFLYLNCLEKPLLKFLLASMKKLTSSGDFTGSHIRISNSGGISQRIETSIQHLKKPITNHLTVFKASRMPQQAFCGGF